MRPALILGVGGPCGCGIGTYLGQGRCSRGRLCRNPFGPGDIRHPWNYNYVGYPVTHTVPWMAPRSTTSWIDRHLAADDSWIDRHFNAAESATRLGLRSRSRSPPAAGPRRLQRMPRGSRSRSRSLSRRYTRVAGVTVVATRCVVCLEEPPQTVFTPCRCGVCCRICVAGLLASAAPQLPECPTCRTLWDGFEALQ